MAAAFALGAEGVQMGTRMVSSLESPIHDNWKQAIVDAPETGTAFVNRFGRPGLRAIRTERTAGLEAQGSVDMGTAFGDVMAVYFGGRLEEGIALAGEVSGRIHSVEPVADVIADTITGFRETAAALGHYT